MANFRKSHVTAPHFTPADFVTKTRQRVLKPTRFYENSQALDQKSPLGWAENGLGHHLEPTPPPPPPTARILLFASFSLDVGHLGFLFAKCPS
jgi:hypothetical protein